MSSAVPQRVKTAAIVVAAGRGVRAESGEIPKQYRPLLGRCALARCLDRFAGHPGIDLVQPVIREADTALYAALLPLPGKVLEPVFGAAMRQGSVRAGLAALAPHRPDVVLIHDAARPFATAALLSRAIEAGRLGAAVPGIAVVDTIKAVDAEDRITATVERMPLRAVQTPQAFPFALIADLHARAAAAGRETFSDDAALAEWAGLPVTVFPGEEGNAKLTTPADFAHAEARLAAALADVRTAGGFDVHAFGPGDHVVLGGVKIAHDHALVGHSDADAALHALTDALLGALGAGDIGQHFPPSDPQWKGASSDRFLAHAAALVAARAGMIAHLDVTIVCEAPRIGPYREAMCERIAAIAGIGASRVSVKATTTETLGFTGRREGIAALAQATIRLPWEPQ